MESKEETPVIETIVSIPYKKGIRTIVDKMYVKGFVMVTRRAFESNEILGYDFLRVSEPTPRLVQFLHSGSLIVVDNDRPTFEAIIYKDGTALITFQYGQIIGSRWLAIIDADTIPK